MSNTIPTTKAAGLDFKIIPIVRKSGHRFECIVDCADYEWLVSIGPWHVTEPKLGRFVVTGGVLAAACVGGDGHAYLHRVIMRASDDQIVDHANRDTMDNRRSNLRIATASQSSANRKYKKLSKSGFIGVCEKRRKFYAQIESRGKRFCLGTFPTVIEAAIAYDNAARECHGEFAVLNFPTQSALIAQLESKEQK